MVWWKKTFLTMLAAALAGAAGMIGIPFLYWIVFQPKAPFGTFESMVSMVVVGLSPFIGAYCAFKASDWVGRFLDRND
jgi:ABC-type branched-subunit amino acid transport system permease subunit